MNENYIFIDDETVLPGICRQLSGSTWLAVDTEFERERTYYPELCLLQIAGTEMTAIIDPLAIADMQPVYDLLYDPSITKVFHSARQDLEIFFHLHRRVPVPLYDTQLAATALGCDNSIGYANLVEQMLGVTLDKAHTRTDWKRRPLKPSHLRYAADDVIYLGKLYQQFLTRITSAETLAALQSEFDKLTDPLLYEPAPETMWKKIRESKRMQGAALELLKVLAAWRELTARTDNLPRKWVLPDQVLVDIAIRMPADQEAVAQIRGLTPDQLERHGDTLLALVLQHCNKS